MAAAWASAPELLVDTEDTADMVVAEAVAAPDAKVVVAGTPLVEY